MDEDSFDIPVSPSLTADSGKEHKYKVATIT
jgi:hypothetical protein